MADFETVLKDVEEKDVKTESPKKTKAKQKKKEVKIKGKGVQIVAFSENSEACQFDRAALSSVLNDPAIRDLPIAVISIVGPTSSGKTSFENYCFRFMERDGSPGWIGGDDEPLLGLEWKPTHGTVTRGIWIWDQPYIVKTTSGQKVAVIFMDTEGLYGKDEVRGRWSHVFGISTAASSIQIFNLKEELTPRDIEELQVFVRLAEIGIKPRGKKGGKKDPKLKPFQRLWFLIRSWRYPEDYEYGEKGGSKYLEDIFITKESDKDHLRKMKESIVDAYQDIYCYLMPHPNDVIYRKNYKGELGSLSNDFRDHLERYITHLLSPEGIRPKELVGLQLTCGRYIDFFGSLIDIFNDGSFPRIDSLMMAISLATKNQLIDHFTKTYEEMVKCELELVLDTSKPRGRNTILAVFRSVQKDVLEMFENHPKFFTREECDEVKLKITEGMKIVHEKISKVYSNKFNDYYAELYQQTLEKMYQMARNKEKMVYVDPSELIRIHSQLKIKIINEVHQLMLLGMDVNMKTMIRRRMDARFIKFSQENEALVEEVQSLKVKYAGVTAGGGILGLTSGSLAAHGMGSAAASSALIGVLAAGLIISGITAIAGAGYIGFKWYKTKISRDKATKCLQSMMSPNSNPLLDESQLQV